LSTLNAPPYKRLRVKLDNFIRTFIFVALFSIAAVSPAQTISPAPTAPSLEQRVADLEAYLNNSARGADAANAIVASNVSGPGPGHNAWMMTASALVLFMTLPGLALFYGGLVRAKNVLSVLAQCLGIAGLVTILWWAVGYSLVFSRGSAFLGGLKFAFLRGVNAHPNGDYSYWVSQDVFAMYQLMFAIITPALIIGAVAERMKFAAVLVFVAVWMFAVYFPIAHMVWGIDGWMNGLWNPSAKIRAIDFAGGTVVHMTSGWSALVLCILLGHRLGFRKEILAPHSMVLCMVGTGLLWVGWYGFNAGSALAPDGIAANAFMTTTLATAVASFTWAMLEYALRGKPSVLGFCSGAVGGLVVITPACGYVDSTGAIGIGVAAGIVPFFACTKLKSWLGYDDALDTFGIHAVGGTLGAFLTGIFATASVNPNLAKLAQGTLWLQQLKAIGITILLAVVGTAIIGAVVRGTIGLRITPEVERQGLDINEHGEEGYMAAG
jgi:Amt family ammonium transporter